METNSEFKCAVCGEAADKSCSSCKRVNYCSAVHQKDHWKVHKKSCAPYNVVEKDGVKLLTLRRNVAQGEIILDEIPLFHVPESNGITVSSICVVCGLHMLTATLNRCSDCTWPVCGIECASHPMHKNNECSMFAASKMTYEPYMIHELVNVITLARAAAVKTTTPNVWTDLKALLSREAPYNDEWNVSNTAEFRKVVKRVLPNYNEKERKAATEDALTLRKVLLRRGFYINAQDILDASEVTRPGKWRAGFYVYKNASLANHSCAPNCVWNVSSFPSFKIRLRAAFPLTKGQVLTINHLEHHAEGQKGTVERRIGYYFRFGTVCTCDRCVDPTELGTYSSAIVCQFCRGPDNVGKVTGENLGYLLPLDNQKAIGLKNNVKWGCNTCKQVVQLSKIYPKVDAIKSQLEVNDGKSFTYNSIDAEQFARRLISEHRDKLLHPNHWLIQKATLILIDNRYPDICNKIKTTDKDVQMMMGHCRFLLDILDRLYPGFSSLKSKVTLTLTGTLAAEMDCVLSKLNNEEELAKNLVYYTEELLRIKRQLLLYYKDDVALERGHEKSEMGEMVEKDVNELVTILASIPKLAD